MDPQTAILLVAFAVLLVLGAPIAVALGIASLLTLASIGDTPACYTVAQRMSTGVASFPLLAIPLFVLAGAVMGKGGMARRLIAFASAVVGRGPAGLPYVSTLTCMLFGAISGSATAAVSSVGGMLIPEMVRKGYSRPFSVAVTTTAATTGLIIPPSNVMIVYALVAGGVSVAALFIAGVLPGVIVGLAIMLVTPLAGPQHEALEDGAEAAQKTISAFIQALPTLFLVVVVLGGILGGVFSPTEAAAIAVLYALLLTVVAYRELSIKDLPGLCVRSASTSAVIFLLIAASQASSWVMTSQAIPQSVSSAMLSLSENPTVVLLTINFLLLVVGAFMDMTPAVLIFTPIFLPVAQELGMHPIHFGVMMIVNLCIGLCTPPVGTCLFVGCGVGGTSIAEVVRPMLPFFFAMIVALGIVAFAPPVSLWLPTALGLLEPGT